MFQHLLREETIKTSFEASGREAAFAELVAMLPSWGVDAQQKSALLDKITDASSESVTFGYDLAIASCVIPGITFPLATLGISKKGILFKGQSLEPVHFAFLIVLPEHEDAQNQENRFMQDIETFAHDKFMKERLKIADSPEEAYEIFLREGQQNQILAQYGI